MIVDAHKAFAKAVVALAREHHMANLTVSFRLGFRSQTDVPYESGQITATWSEGRHGAAGNIGLRGEAFASVQEDGEHYPG